MAVKKTDAKEVNYFKVGDKVRHIAGSHVYEILAFGVNEWGRDVAYIDPELPNCTVDLKDIEKAK